MRKRFMYIILPVVTLILEILPYGAVCNFARPATNGSIGHFRELYSYFDLLPFGYANFAPFITAILTCVILLLLAIYCLTGNSKFLVYTKRVVFACAIISFGPIVLGIRFLSFVGILITLTLIAELVLINRIDS